jgi:Spx/MgsR family transcriptional regulator
MTMSIQVYGLEKCDTCKKARKWLDRHEVDYRFVDYRVQPITPATLKQWASAVGGFEKLVNRAGTTWRNLAPTRKNPGSDAEWTLLIREYPALVRRPVVVLADGTASLGFSDKLFEKLFGG